jgi:hypothetical protein
VKGDIESNIVSYIDTMFAYYLPSVNTSSLSDTRWAEMYKQLLDIRKKEAGSKN